MDRELVIFVPSEAAAHETVKALKALDDVGTIELYASTVVARSANGTFSVVKKDVHTRDPVPVTLGASAGVLLGLLAGPIAAAVGAAAGVAATAAAAGAALGGAAFGTAAFGGQLVYSGFVGEFVYAIAAKLQPGSYAVLASVWEDWTVPVDTAVAPHGAVVFRQATDEVVAAQVKADWQATQEELVHLDAEIAKAIGEEKSKLEAKRDELREKQAAQRRRVEDRVRKLEASWDARIASMHAKANAARADARVRHEQHAEKLSHFATAQKQAFRDLFA